MSYLTGTEELRLYRGEDYILNEHVSIHIPSLGEICDYGEDEYFSLIRQFTSTPTDMCFQLSDMGIDFTEITDYQLFSQLLAKTLSLEHTSLLFKDLDFQKAALKANPDGNIVMDYGDWYIDECTYEIIADCLRSIHFFKKNVAIPANEATKEILIEDAREAALMQRSAPQHSLLLNMVSTMVNTPGFKYNHHDVWDMKINAFMDSVMRIGKIKNADLLLQSGYSGFGINLKTVNKKELDWMGDLY